MSRNGKRDMNQWVATCHDCQQEKYGPYNIVRDFAENHHIENGKTNNHSVFSLLQMGTLSFKKD